MKAKTWILQKLQQFRQRRAARRQLLQWQSQWRSGALRSRLRQVLLSQALRHLVGFVAVAQEPTGWFLVVLRLRRLIVKKMLNARPGQGFWLLNKIRLRCLRPLLANLRRAAVLALRAVMISALCLILRLLGWFLGRFASCKNRPGS